MIGPEERKVDHVKEHAAQQHFGEDEPRMSDSPDYHAEKVHDENRDSHQASEHTLEQPTDASARKLSGEHV